MSPARHVLIATVGAALLTAAACNNSSTTPSTCAQVRGTYQATLSGTSFQQPATTTITLAQQGCAVSATVRGYGQLRCTAAPVGTSPRLGSCTETISACTAQKDYTFQPTDDGTAFTFDVVTRQTACTGTDGGTLLFRLALTPQR